MPNYRAYIVGNDGHFKAYEDIIADDDVKAVTIAEKLVEVEVSHFKRKVAVLPRKVGAVEIGKTRSFTDDVVRQER